MKYFAFILLKRKMEHHLLLDGRNGLRIVQNIIQKILQKLDKDTVLQELSAMTGGQDFALVCYEKPGDFCHRHLVAEWLGLNGEEIEL